MKLLKYKVSKQDSFYNIGAQNAIQKRTMAKTGIHCKMKVKTSE